MKAYFDNLDAWEAANDARRLCSKILDYVEAGPPDDHLYEMVRELGLMLHRDPGPWADGPEPADDPGLGPWYAVGMDREGREILQAPDGRLGRFVPTRGLFR